MGKNRTTAEADGASDAPVTPMAPETPVTPKFRWPPQRIDVVAKDRAFGMDARGVARDERAAQDALRAVEIEHEPKIAPEATEASVAMGRPKVVLPPPRASTWNAFEHAWLGVTSEPWSRRRQAAEIDGAGAACWRCGSPIGMHEAGEDGCATCRPMRLPWARLVRVGAYEGVLRDAIREVKFRRFSTLGLELGAELGAALGMALTGEAQGNVARDQADDARVPVVLVPVPMPLLRRLSRGVDHTKAIAVGAARRLRAQGVDARVAHVLARKHRPSQLEVTPSQRFRNAAGSFVTPWPLRVTRWAKRLGAQGSGRWFGRGDIPIGPLSPTFRGVVVVVDDVRTTGATMAAACRQVRRTVRDAGCPNATIWGAVVAVASHRGLELGESGSLEGRKSV